MSDKELIQNDYKVKVEGNEAGEYKVSINDKDSYSISIEELSTGSLWRVNVIAVVALAIIIGLTVFFCYKLDSLNDKVTALQEKVESNANGKLETTESTQVELKKQTDDLNRSLLELQESNKALEDKLENSVKPEVKQINKQQDISEEDYYLIEKSKIPVSNHAIPTAPTAPSMDLKIPEVPSTEQK